MGFREAANDGGDIETLEFLLDKAKLLDVQHKMLAANDYEAFWEAISEDNIRSAANQGIKKRKGV